MNLDLEGVDWQIAYPGARGTSRSPRIEFQVKTSMTSEIRDRVIRYRLRVAHFNHLAGLGFQIPRYLALVAVPPDPKGYAVCTDDYMRLSTAAYWLSLADHEVRPTGDGHPDSVVVEIPTRNLLTVTSLQCLLTGDLEGAVQ